MRLIKFILIFLLVLNLGFANELFDAVKAGDIEAVTQLINNGARVNLKDKTNDNYTALMYAAETGRTELVELLVSKGAEVNVKNDNGWTALGLASSWGYVDTVKVLLENGASINAVSNDGMTPLMAACRFGYPETVRELLKHGANPLLKNKEGKTALRLANEWGYSEIVGLLEKESNKVVGSSLPEAPKMKVKQQVVTKKVDPITVSEIMSTINNEITMNALTNEVVSTPSPQTITENTSSLNEAITTQAPVSINQQETTKNLEIGF